MDDVSSQPLPLCAAQIPQAADMLARAFHHDPMMVYLFPDARTRDRRSVHCFAVILRYGLSSGDAYRTPDGLDGVAVWLPPGPVRASWGTMLRCGFPWLLPKVGLAVFRRLLRYHDHMTELRQRLLPAEHWYLQLLGVSPGCQGRGLAKSLLTPILARLDRLGLPCGLDTMNARNLEIYQRFGFHVVHDSTFPKSDMRLWVMLRDARSEAD